MTTQAILFDLDGTLVDTERQSAEAMVRALSELGISANQADRDFIIGRSWVDIYARLRALYSSLSWSRDELIARTTAARAGVFDDEGITILPGALEAVERFRTLPLAIVTGSSRAEAAQVLDALGLVDAFRYVVAAEDVATSKPDPAGYLKAAQALGFPAANCAVVEDSAAGIAAGRAAGARVVAVRAGNFAGQNQGNAHVVIESLVELTEQVLGVAALG